MKTFFKVKDLERTDKNGNYKIETYNVLRRTYDYVESRRNLDKIQGREHYKVENERGTEFNLTLEPMPKWKDGMGNPVMRATINRIFKYKIRSYYTEVIVYEDDKDGGVTNICPMTTRPKNPRAAQ